MKSAFESSFILLFTMPILFFCINFIEIMMHYNQARHFQNYIITQIEHQNRYDEDVIELIEPQLAYCYECNYYVHEEADRYRVSVQFLIDIHLLNYSTYGQSVSLTQPIK